MVVVAPALQILSVHQPAEVCQPKGTTEDGIHLSSKTHPYLGEIFSKDLHEIGHGIVHDVVPPGQLQDDVWTQEVIARVEASSKAVRPVNLEEPGNQVLSNFSVPGVTGILHGILEKGMKIIHSYTKS